MAFSLIAAWVGGILSLRSTRAAGRSGEAGKRGSVVVWPNPTHGKFQITNSKFQNSKYKIEIVDLFGNILETRTPEHRNTGTQELDISHLPAGIYFIRIHLDNQTIVKKIIKL